MKKLFKRIDIKLSNEEQHMDYLDMFNLGMEVANDSATIEEDTALLETADQSVVELDGIKLELEEIIDQGTIDNEATSVVASCEERIAVICDRLGLDVIACSTESSDGVTLSTEGIGDVLLRIVEAISTLISKLITAIRNLYAKIIVYFNKASEKVDELIKATDELKNANATVKSDKFDDKEALAIYKRVGIFLVNNANTLDDGFNAKLGKHYGYAFRNEELVGNILSMAKDNIAYAGRNPLKKTEAELIEDAKHYAATFKTAMGSSKLHKDFSINSSDVVKGDVKLVDKLNDKVNSYTVIGVNGDSVYIVAHSYMGELSDYTLKLDTKKLATDNVAKLDVPGLTSVSMFLKELKKVADGIKDKQNSVSKILKDAESYNDQMKKLLKDKTENNSFIRLFYSSYINVMNKAAYKSALYSIDLVNNGIAYVNIINSKYEKK